MYIYIYICVCVCVCCHPDCFVVSLRQSDILPQRHRQPLRKRKYFTHKYYFSFVYICT